MPCIVTTVHDPVALAATCRQFNIPLPEFGCVHLYDQEASGWIVRQSGVRFPIVCDTLTGLIAYHPADNVFNRYARIMRFVYRYFDVQAQLRRGHQPVDATPHRTRLARRHVLARIGR